MRKTLLITALCVGLISNIEAQQLRTPQASSTQTIKQDLGLGSIELNYSRPGIKGRKVFGDLVPFGNVWRTGANNATVITFSDPVTIGGTKVPAGKYGLVTIPNKDSWTIIVTKQLDITNPNAHKPENDVVRVQAKPTTLKETVETFTMQFADVTSSSTSLQMLWENTAVSLPIATDIDTKIMADINSIMNQDNKPYYPAAVYYLNNGKDLNQALAWFDKAKEQNPNAYWVWHERAKCLAKLGRKEEAIASANKSLETAKSSQPPNPDYVTLNEKLIASLK